MATKLYDAGKYSKAIRIFEQIAPAYRGKLKQKNCFICSLNPITKQNNIH
jgi:outer membrane protein assembly factor BamD